MKQPDAIIEMPLARIGGGTRDGTRKPPASDGRTGSRHRLGLMK